jgi:hypothetical protein
MPIGVAALPRPKKLAQILALKSPARMLSFRLDGKSHPSTGRSSRESAPVNPAFSISFPTPLHKQTGPAKDMDRVMPACAPWAVAAANCEPRPKTTADIILMPISAVQIQLIIRSITFPWKVYAPDAGKLTEKTVAFLKRACDFSLTQMVEFLYNVRYQSF